MSKKNWLKKGVILTVIVLSIGINVIPSAGYIEKENDLPDDLLSFLDDNEVHYPGIKASTWDNIVYTAHQSFGSRIYLLRPDGTIITYYEYSNVRLLDLEVVNNEVYVVESFSPLVYKVDLNSGDLETIILDSSLSYLYGLAFDGTYFYAAESDLNRYDINGNKQGTASFDGTVLGATWDGVFYWTLNDANQIKCWDISSWPTITPGPYEAIAVPSINCRGLWFDGLYFWTAESINDTLGKIYQFDYYGEVVNQWIEPAFIGWSACIINVPNDPPYHPEIPTGPISGSVGIEYNYTTSTIDPEDHQIYLKWDWGDGTISDWMGPYNSSVTIKSNHSWTKREYYEIKVKSKDIYDAESDWSETLTVDIIDEKINFLIGRIYNFKEGPYFCTFNADKLIWISNPPLEIKYYNSVEKLAIRSDYNGIVKDHFIICIF